MGLHLGGWWVPSPDPRSPNGWGWSTTSRRLFASKASSEHQPQFPHWPWPSSSPCGSSCQWWPLVSRKQGSKRDAAFRDHFYGHFFHSILARFVVSTLRFSAGFEVCGGWSSADRSHFPFHSRLGLSIADNDAPIGGSNGVHADVVLPDLGGQWLPSKVSELQAEARPRTPMQEQVVTLMVKELQIFHPRNVEASHLWPRVPGPLWPSLHSTHPKKALGITWGMPSWTSGGQNMPSHSMHVSTMLGWRDESDQPEASGWTSSNAGPRGQPGDPVEICRRGIPQGQSPCIVNVAGSPNERLQGPAIKRSGRSSHGLHDWLRPPGWSANLFHRFQDGQKHGHDIYIYIIILQCNKENSWRQMSHFQALPSTSDLGIHGSHPVNCCSKGALF